MSAAVPNSMCDSAQRSLENYRGIRKLAPDIMHAELKILLSLAENETGATFDEIRTAAKLSYNATFLRLRSLRAAGYIEREGRRDRVRSGPARMFYRLSLAQGGGR